MLRGRRRTRVPPRRCKLKIERAGGLGDLRHVPLQQLLHGAHCGRQQREVRALAHVEAPRALVVVFGVQDQAREIAGIGALNPVFFQRISALPFWCDVEKPDGIRPEQPFVVGGDGEIRLHVAYAEGQRAERLGQIENERGAELTASCADADQVKSVRRSSTARAGARRWPHRGSGNRERRRSSHGPQARQRSSATRPFLPPSRCHG